MSVSEMNKEEFFNKIRKMPLSEWAKKIDDTDSITHTLALVCGSIY